MGRPHVTPSARTSLRAMAYAVVVALTLGGVLPSATTVTAATWPPATAWARASLLLPPQVQPAYADQLMSIDGSRLAYIAAPHPGWGPQRGVCPRSLHLRVWDLHTRATTATASLPPPLDREHCYYYADQLQLSGSWLVFGMKLETINNGAIETETVRALNLVTHREKDLAVVTPDVVRRGITTSVFSWDFADGVLAQQVIWTRSGGIRATGITVTDVASGRTRVVVRSPWAVLLPSGRWPPGSWFAIGVAVSEAQVVWTRETVGAGDTVMLSNWRTVALSHDGISMRPRIYHDTVAWIVSRTRSLSGDIHVLDLHTGMSTTITGQQGYNEVVGDGLVSWMAGDVVPLYFVRQHAVRYYTPTPAQQALSGGASMVRGQLFGRTILVSTILHWDGAAVRWIWTYQIDTF